MWNNLQEFFLKWHTKVMFTNVPHIIWWGQLIENILSANEKFPDHHN